VSCHRGGSSATRRSPSSAATARGTGPARDGGCATGARDDRLRSLPKGDVQYPPRGLA
jgi:hypothetical protein